MTLVKFRDMWNSAKAAESQEFTLVKKPLPSAPGSPCSQNNMHAFSDTNTNSGKNKTPLYVCKNFFQNIFVCMAHRALPVALQGDTGGQLLLRFHWRHLEACDYTRCQAHDPSEASLGDQGPVNILAKRWPHVSRGAC